MCMCIHIHDIEIDRFPVQLRRKVQQTHIKVGALSVEMVGVFSNVVCDGCGPGFGSPSPPLMAADQVSVDTLGNLKTGRHRTPQSQVNTTMSQLLEFDDSVVEAAILSSFNSIVIGARNATGKKNFTHIAKHQDLSCR